MPKDENILADLRECFKKAMRLDEATAGTIDEQTHMSNVEAWDSIAHFRLIITLEEHFGVRFEDEQIAELVSVDAIVSTLTRDQ
jgi:acyl carrier protein